MFNKSTTVVLGSLLGGAFLLAGAVASVNAFGGGQGGPGFEGRGGPGMMHEFGKGRRGGLRMIDTDKDGVITKEEAVAAREKRFAKFDTDKNGEVTAEEAVKAFGTRFEGPINRRVRALDENGDGKVTREEFNIPAMERFAARDANGDGKITRDEMPRRMGRGHGGKRGGKGGCNR